MSSLMLNRRTLSRSVGQNVTTTTGGVRPTPRPADCASSIGAQIQIH